MGGKSLDLMALHVSPDVDFEDRGARDSSSLMSGMGGGAHSSSRRGGGGEDGAGPDAATTLARLDQLEAGLARIEHALAGMQEPKVHSGTMARRMSSMNLPPISASHIQ
eukprot:NODE_6777_length_435_cov_56.463731_g5184_i0.p1 GENE.NODE_6777_length_435_cov_56.463731_g5184_i0~~NODE_6777_length_435_cov_56.463731_g5184_i0.p1  ORF type:complete len:118 (-),score=36.21 NODE_6777_length_435_cov_56.463731_g5184_i0:81-407(-)